MTINDRLPANSENAEEIALCAVNTAERYASLCISGAYAASKCPIRGAHAANNFMFHAQGTARQITAEFGTEFTTLDVIQAAGILAIYYEDHAAELAQVEHGNTAFGLGLAQAYAPR